MKIRFLGTAAAEAWPAIFCNCETCNKARLNKGKNIRTRFSLMLDDKYKVDFPPDSYHHLLAYNLDYLKLKYLFISHPHTDHLAPYEFEFLRTPFTHVRNHKLNIYGWEKSIELIKEGIGYEDENFPNLNCVQEFEKIDTDDFEVYVLPANHMHEKDHPFNYLFVKKSNQKTFLCAHDTGTYADNVWDFLKNFKIDIISLDCTYGLKDNYYNHLGGKALIDIKNKLLKMGVLKENARFFANHFSHNSGSMHEEMVKYYKPYGIEVAYDGLEIEF